MYIITTDHLPHTKNGPVQNKKKCWKKRRYRRQRTFQSSKEGKQCWIKHFFFICRMPLPVKYFDSIPVNDTKSSILNRHWLSISVRCPSRAAIQNKTIDLPSGKKNHFARARLIDSQSFKIFLNLRKTSFTVVTFIRPNGTENYCMLIWYAYYYMWHIQKSFRGPS